MNAGDAVRFGRTVAAVAKRRRLTLLAGSIAYSAFLSAIPLLVLTFTVATVVTDERAAVALVEMVGAVLTPTAQGVLREALVGASGRAATSVLGIAVLLWSTMRVFRGLNAAFAAVYGRTDDTFLTAARDGTVALGAVGLGAIAVIVAAATVGSVIRSPLLSAASPLLLAGALTIVFFPLYYVLPDADMSPAEALPGAVLAAVGWVVLGSLFRVYVALLGSESAYGLLGGVILLLTWLYVGSLVLLLGAVVNAVRADPDGAGEPVLPAEG